MTTGEHNLRSHQPVDVDALVAQYAPLGRRLRRRNQLLRSALLVAIPLALGLIALAWSARGSLPGLMRGSAGPDARVESALAEVREMKASLAAEAGAATAQRQSLARQLQLFLERNARLAEQLTAVDAQQQALALQRDELAKRQGELAAALAQSDARRQSLEAGGKRQPDIERQLAEIARQRQELARRQQQFLDQGEALARQLAAINQQRSEIEQQRKAIAEQQAEVRRMLEELNKVSAARKPVPAAPAGAMPAGEELPSLAQVAMVAPEELGEVRGGINLGGDYNIAIGITRTTSINGVEQFASSMYLNDLAAAVGAGAGNMAALDPVLIQVGSGNSVSADTLSALSPAVTTIIQNTLDNQDIAHQTVLDISLQNIGVAAEGLQISHIVNDSLARQP